jgi:hypothetical protein
MRKRISLVAVGAVMAIGGAVGPAAAVADQPMKNIPSSNPNAAGNSGHFHPNSTPCSNSPTNPHCPPFGP